MESSEFEWDEAKRLRNLELHGVDFPRAALIFDQPVLEARDDREDYGEERWRALGRVEEQYLVVVYTRRGVRRRLISAWMVGEDGKRRYQAVFARRDS